MSGTLKTNMKKSVAPVTETKATETSTSTSTTATTPRESFDITTAYQVAKAQNEVLLALINRYFDFNETAITQGFDFLGKLLAEGLDFAKASLESKDAHTEVRLEMELEESKHRQELEREKLGNQHEIALIDLGLSKTRQELDVKARLQELAESKARHNLEQNEQALKNLERLTELRKADPNRETPELWDSTFLAQHNIQNINAPTENAADTVEQTAKVTEKLKEWGFLDSPLTKDATSNIENLITTVSFSNKKATDKAVKKESTPKKPKGTPKA